MPDIFLQNGEMDRDQFTRRCKQIDKELDFSSPDGRRAGRALEELAQAHGQLLDRLAETEEFLRALIESRPVYRDHTGTDQKTCAYCGRALEGSAAIRPEAGTHRDDCPWRRAQEFLAGGDAGGDA